MNEKLKGKSIAVLCGGVSGERDVSLRSGNKVHASLLSQGLNAILVDTKEDFIPVLRHKKIDLACIMLHGTYGEDGCIQGLLEILGIPYTGSKVLASAVGMNKVASKRIWISQGIQTPKYFIFNEHGDVKAQCDQLLKIFPLPLVIKPVSEGSSLGVSLIKTADQLEPVARDTISKFRDVFVEEFVNGTEVTVGVLEKDGVPEALPVLELKPNAEFYDFTAKYTKGGTQFIIPARLPRPVYALVQKSAIRAFTAIGCRGFARIDMIVDRDGTPFVHEANTIPGMTDLSDLPAQALAAGISYDDLVSRILESAL